MARPRNEKLTAHKRKDGRWMVWIYLGRKRTPVYGQSEEEALQAAMDALRIRSEVQKIGKAHEPGSVEEFVETAWRAGKDIRATSKLRYRVNLDYHILPTIGHLQLAQVKYEDILALKNGLRRHDGREGPLSDRSKREVLALVKDIFHLAEIVRGIQDPTRAVALPKIKKKTVREEPEEDFTVRLLKAARESEHDKWMEGPIFAACFLGLRRGEICGLKRSDVDRKKLLLRIRSQRHPAYGQRDVSPKAGSERVIPIPPEILAWLDRFSRHNSIYVFCQTEGKPIFPNEVTQKGPELCEKAGLARRRFHDLRAFAASNLIALGVDPITVMEILGHSRLDTSLLYMDAKAKAKREALRELLSAAKLEEQA